VDGLNARASGFGGAADGRGFYGILGSVTMPLGSRYGLQIDGVGANFDSRFQRNLAGAGVAVHPFWRDPSVGLLGAYGQYIHLNAFSGVDLLAGAAEGALYLGRFTIEGIAGALGGRADLGAFGKIDIPTRFLDVVSISYYPTDNLKLSIGHNYILGQNAATVGAELGWPIRGGTMAAVSATGSVTESGNTMVLVGLTFYFGQRAKTLIRRHREDDPFAFALLPPEINSSRMFAGVGSAPLLAAAAGWQGLENELGGRP
jgi:hypothetical protein